MFTQNEKINFFTLIKEERSYFAEKMVERKFKIFKKVGKIYYFPPTADYIMTINTGGKCKELQPIPKTLGLVKNEPSEKDKVKFKENIEIQEKVLDEIKNRNENYHYRCGLIRLTTGKGKSMVIIDVANYYQTETLVLVHNVKTLGEMCQKFKQFTNIEPSQYGGGKKKLGKITVMTKRSFCTDYKLLKDKYKLVLIDEAPIGFSKAFWEGMSELYDGEEGIALYGLSGTPQKNELDVKDLEFFFGRVIKVDGQKNNGYNIIPKFTFYDYYTPIRYRYEQPFELRECLSKNDHRTAKQIEIAELLKLGRKCLLILSDRKEEVQNLYDHLSGARFCMTGDTKNKDDDANIALALKLTEQGTHVTIIGTIQKIGVGVDIPFIDTILLASAIKFKSTVIQAIGRGLRKYEGKNDVICAVWNDLPHYDSQRSEKRSTIKKEYLVQQKDIKIIRIS